jgi:hypothetical protein
MWVNREQVIAADAEKGPGIQVFGKVGGIIKPLVEEARCGFSAAGPPRWH